jgi:Tn3 transposase DDE domain
MAGNQRELSPRSKRWHKTRVWRPATPPRSTIVLYNTIYTQRALDHIAATTDNEPRNEDIERLSPLGSDHTTLTGRYRVLLPAPLQDRGAYRALNTPEDAAAA